MSEIQLGKKIYIRNSEKDEYWLQDIIYANPDKLGLGDLVIVSKEKKQSSGGRIDILLKEPNSNTMYEVEVMLGETDPSHIIRTIEYWDNEKRRYPQRQHYAVLIAESFDRRYFNVIQLLSLNVPMIAIQADLLEVGENKVLNFTKILNVYTEPEDEEEATEVTEATWAEKSSWTLSAAKEHLKVLNEIENKCELRFAQSYISIFVNGKSFYRFDKRTKPQCVVWFKEAEDEKVDAIKALLDKSPIVYTYNNYQDFTFTYEKKLITQNTELLQKIHQIRIKEYTTEE